MSQQDLTLGVELGSTRIKAVVIDSHYRSVATGEYTWQSTLRDGIWTYDLAEALLGLKAALRALPEDVRARITRMGLSGMMHGYLAFDEHWQLLVPFRTWQNTITAKAASLLSRAFAFNIPQRWSIAHLYEAMLRHEAHLPRLAHITTLAGYLHYCLTGENAVGVGEASGMFPIDTATGTYDETMLQTFTCLSADQPWDIRKVLPRVLPAGQCAGHLHAQGAALLDNLLPKGLPFAPPEGDGPTGMVATNAVAARSGNVSGGTSIFALVVLEKPLSRLYEELDVCCTPSGKPVAMVHCNNCTADMNAWAQVLREAATLFGAQVTTEELFTSLYQQSLQGDADAGGVVVCNYLSGEGVTHLDSGRPMVLREANSQFTLANFLRAQLYATMATLHLGMELLARENVRIDTMTAHGGLFKTPGVGQAYMAACCNTPITCMETADMGGAYGMALLAAYSAKPAQTLEEFLAREVFAHCRATTVAPDAQLVAGFARYMQRFTQALPVEKLAVEALS